MPIRVLEYIQIVLRRVSLFRYVRGNAGVMIAFFRRTLGLGVLASFLLVTNVYSQQVKADPEKEPFHPTRIIVKYAAQG